MPKFIINKVSILVLILVFFSISVNAQDSDLESRLLGTWVCDSVPGDGEGAAVMVNTLKFTFKENGVVEIAALIMGEVADTASGVWRVVDNERDKIDLCVSFGSYSESEEIPVEEEDCDELFCEFLTDAYILLTDREDDVYFRRE